MYAIYESLKDSTPIKIEKHAARFHDDRLLFLWKPFPLLTRGIGIPRNNLGFMQRM